MFLVIVDILEEALDFSTSSPPYSNQNKYSSSFESELTKTSWHQAYCQRTQRPKTLTVLRQSGKKKNPEIGEIGEFLPKWSRGSYVFREQHRELSSFKEIVRAVHMGGMLSNAVLCSKQLCFHMWTQRHLWLPAQDLHKVKAVNVQG